MEYRPGRVPSDPALIPDFLSKELARLQKALWLQQAVLKLLTLHAAPTKYDEGDVVIADGTDWNPGSGAGAYRRSAVAWVFLG